MSCAVSGCGVDDGRGDDFGVSGSLCLVEEEVDECTLEPCSFSFIYGESGSGDFHAEVEVDEVVFLGKLPVRECVLRKLGFQSSGLDDEVVGRCFSFGHFVVWQVGDGVEQVLHLLECAVLVLFERLVGFLDECDTLLGRFGFFLLAFLHQSSDVFRCGIYFSQVAVELCLCGLAFIV